MLIKCCLSCRTRLVSLMAQRPLEATSRWTLTLAVVEAEVVVVAVDVVADSEADAVVDVALAAGTVAEVCTTKSCRHSETPPSA